MVIVGLYVYYFLLEFRKLKREIDKVVKEDEKKKVREKAIRESL